MTRITTNHLASIIGVLIVFGPSPGFAAPLFEDDAALDVTLTGPIGSLFEDTKDHKELPFIFLAEGIEHAIKVRLRGHSRLRVCDFPPLRLKFPMPEAEQTSFAEQGKLKLVTHCRNHDRGEQDMLQEFLAYRIFNVLTDASYRVRLLRITYDDTDRQPGKNSSIRYGFLLEPGEQLAARIGAAAASLRGVPKHRQDFAHSALVYVFQYLIGNTDWGFVQADYDDACCHNGDLYERDAEVLYVPYDFDLAGLVNSQYAYPDPLLRIDRVTQRLYRGVCTDHDILQNALANVKSHKEEILALLQDIPGLDEKNVDTSSKFLNAFFEKAEDEEKLLRTFERSCI